VTLWALPSTPRTRASVPAAVLAVADVAVIAILLYLEHKRSIKPSIILTVYLLISTLVDVAQVRSLFLRNGMGAIATVFAASTAVKLVLLCLEEITKRSLLLAKFKNSALESTSGAINRSIFWWLNELFWKGYNSLLTPTHLSTIDETFQSRSLHSKISKAWAKS
jgi:ATP-binding cassette, subfamily C (CFTR/MRP), member 1